MEQWQEDSITCLQLRWYETYVHWNGILTIICGDAVRNHITMSLDGVLQFTWIRSLQERYISNGCFMSRFFYVLNMIKILKTVWIYVCMYVCMCWVCGNYMKWYDFFNVWHLIYCNRCKIILGMSWLNFFIILLQKRALLIFDLDGFILNKICLEKN